MTPREIARLSAHAQSRVSWLIDASRTAWVLKVAGWKALDPRASTSTT